MRWAMSHSRDYKDGQVVVRDMLSDPPGRVLCVVVRSNIHDAEQQAQWICDSLNGRTE